MRLLDLLRRQDGISLVMAVGVLGLLSVTGTTVVYYSNTNARSAEFSQDNGHAYDLAEAGLNEMMAVLSNPENNALNANLLPETTRTYDGGTVTWWGTFDKPTARWSLTSIGRVKNPTGAGTDVTRTLTAKVPVTPTTTQPLNNPSWNYIMSTQTGNTCDMTIGSTVEVKTNLYVFGNLCLEQSAKILRGDSNATTLVVNGRLDQATQQNTVGLNGQPIAEVRVANGCEWFSNALVDECRPEPTSPETKVYAQTFSHEPATLVGPSADYDAWYLNAAPGPYYPCTSMSGSPPTFDAPVASSTASDSTKLTYKNNNLASQNLTPTSSYTCRVAGGGELSWDATNRILTVAGTVYIDGDAKIEFSQPTVVQYNGQATIYLSGSLLVKNVKLCGGVLGQNCDFASWNPNTAMLVLAAAGDNRQPEVSTGFSISMKNSQFQGALYATKKMDIDSFSKVDGPMVATEVVLGQSVQTNDFPNIATVPAGMPGNPTVYAQPNPPQLYSG